MKAALVGGGYFFAVLLSGVAQAGTLSGTNWAPSNCGAEPVAPTIDDSSEKLFTASLELQDRFSAQSEKYLACVGNEAHADSEALSASFDTIKGRLAKVDGELDAAVDAGLKKYGSKKK